MNSRGGRRGLQDEARALSQRTDEELQRLGRERQKRGRDIEGRVFCVPLSYGGTSGHRGKMAMFYVSDGTGVFFKS